MAKRWEGMEREHLAGSDSDQRFQLMPSEGKTPVPCEYAKYKNRPIYFMIAGSSASPKPSFVRARPAAGNLAMTDDPAPPAAPAPETERKPLTPAAQRALAEAEARRKAAAANAQPAAKEFQGPKGPEPTRYGDWESKGIASDF
jgi:hypothetical protein